MSTQRGNVDRKRTQKYKNKTAFKNDLHDKTPQQKRINSLHVAEVCQHCKSVIEWKIKYKKYKPLTQAKTCIRCSQRNVKKAYHVLCPDCAKATQSCAKCLKSAKEVDLETPQPNTEEQIKLKVEMERLIKSLPERKRRAFLRYMKKGKAEAEPEESDIREDEHKDDKPKQTCNKSIPHSRDDLLAKIEKLRVVCGEDNEDDSDDSDDVEQCSSSDEDKDGE